MIFKVISVQIMRLVHKNNIISRKFFKPAFDVKWNLKNRHFLTFSEIIQNYNLRLLFFDKIQSAV